MAIKNRLKRKNQTQLTTVHLMNDTDDIVVSRKEPTVDLFVVFDENQKADSNCADNRVIDISSDPPQVKEHNYYKVLFESSIDGIFIVDAETMRILLANQTAADLYGFDNPEDMLGVNPLILVHPDEKDKVLRIIAQDVIGNNLRLIHRFRGIAKDGKEIWVRAVGSRTEYQGKLAALISIRDISGQVEVEEENQQLEQRIEFASRLASIGDLASGIAHQLNDPLSAVLAYDQLLIMKKDLDENVRNGLEAIYRETRRATTITDNLRLFANRHKPEKGLISINEVMQRAIDLCSYQIGVNNIEISMEFDPHLPKTMADFQQMRQVFVNIINNAEQAITKHRGHGEINITSQVVDDTIRITFMDNGPGISEDNLPKIFDPFFTANESDKRTGLGLAVCYGLVEGHDGRIHADSTLDKGTTITVEIPVISADQYITEQFDTANINSN